MLDTINQWLVDPTVQKLVASLVGLLVIAFVVQLLHRAVTHRIQQSDTRHRVRKVINFAGYLAAFLLVAFVLAEEKGHLTIVVGVAMAAVAFSLQEAIASVAGWPLPPRPCSLSICLDSTSDWGRGRKTGNPQSNRNRQEES